MKPYTHHKDPAEIVSTRRSELSLTQTELAKKLGYQNVNFVSMLESGKSKIPLEKTIDIADALEMDRQWFVEVVLRQRFPVVAAEIFDKKRRSAAA
jgi:transcriptional regulator with XRE-family HTH domain